LLGKDGKAVGLSAPTAPITRIKAIRRFQAGAGQLRKQWNGNGFVALESMTIHRVFN